MTVKETLDQLLQKMPDERLCEILDFAQFLTWRQEEEGWRRFGQAQFARSFGPNEPEYTQADLKPEPNP